MKKKFIFSREIGHRRKTTTNKNPFVLNDHDVAVKYEAKGRKCSVGKWRPWLFSGVAKLTQPGPKSFKWDLPTKHPERTVITEWVEEGPSLWKTELSWFGFRCVFYPPSIPSSSLWAKLLFPKRNPFHMTQACVPHLFGHRDDHMAGALPDFSMRSDVWKVWKSLSLYLWDRELKGSMAFCLTWS